MCVLKALVAEAGRGENANVNFPLFSALIDNSDVYFGPDAVNLVPDFSNEHGAFSDIIDILNYM